MNKIELTAIVNGRQACEDSINLVAHQNGGDHKINQTELSNRNHKCKYCTIEVNRNEFPATGQTGSETSHIRDQNGHTVCQVCSSLPRSCWFIGRTHRQPRHHSASSRQWLHFLQYVFPSNDFPSTNQYSSVVS